MSRPTLRRAVLILMLAGALAISPSVASALFLPPGIPITFRVTNILPHGTGFTYNYPSIGGRWLVGQYDFATGSYLRAHDLRTGSQPWVTLPADTGDQTDAEVSGSRVVFMDDRAGGGNNNIYLRDIATGNETAISTNAANEWSPVIDGDLVAWVRDGSPVKAYWRDLERATGAQEVTSVAVGQVDVDNGRIVYSVPGAATSLYMYDLRTEKHTPLLINSTGNHATAPRIHGDSVTFMWNDNFLHANDPMLMDRRTRVSFDVTTTGLTERMPAVFDDKVVFASPNASPDKVRFEEVAPRRSQFLSTSGGTQWYPSIWSNRIVWDDITNGDVYVATRTPDATRAAGVSRYDTAIETSKRHFEAADCVILANGQGFADALSASALAGTYDCPVLLTPRDHVPASVIAEIDRLDPTRVIVVGGSAAVSNDAVNDLADGFTGTVERMWGNTRYATAAAIADRVVARVGTKGNSWSHGVYICNGDKFPDALAVSPLAYQTRSPILLVKKDSLPSETAVRLAAVDPDWLCVIGGTGAVSDATMNAVKVTSGVGGYVRWAGADRYATASRVASEAVADQILDLDMVGLASGAGFADALAGGAACGAYGSPLLLTSPTALSGATNTFLTDKQWEIGGLEVFGGTGAVSASTYNAANARLR